MAARWHPQYMVNISRYVAAWQRDAWQHGGWRVIVPRVTLLTDAHYRTPPGGFPTDSLADLEDLPMPDAVKVGFVPFSDAPRGVLVVFCDDTLKLGEATRKALGNAAT